MRGTLIAVCVVAAGILSAGSSWADTKTIRMSGAWELFGGTSSKGLGVCGISTEPAGRYFGLKVFADRRQQISIHIGGKGMPVTKGQRTAIRAQIDARPAWTGTGTGFTFDDDDPGIEFTVTGASANFVAELMGGSVLRFSLPDIAMPEWSFNLAGTGALQAEYNQCLQTLR